MQRRHLISAALAGALAPLFGGAAENAVPAQLRDFRDFVGAPRQLLPGGAPVAPYNGRAPGAAGAHRRAAAKARRRRLHKRACGMRGRSRR